MLTNLRTEYSSSLYQFGLLAIQTERCHSVESETLIFVHSDLFSHQKRQVDFTRKGRKTCSAILLLRLLVVPNIIFQLMFHDLSCSQPSESRYICISRGISSPLMISGMGRVSTAAAKRNTPLWPNCRSRRFTAVTH